MKAHSNFIIEEMSSRQKWKKTPQKHSKRSVLKALQSFPAASITDSLKESFLSFISFSWLKSIISSSATLFIFAGFLFSWCLPQMWVSKQSGESRRLRTETATNTEQKLFSSVFVLAIHLFYCVSSRLYNSDTAPQTPHNDYTDTRALFSLSVIFCCGKGTVQMRIYYFGSKRQEQSCTSKIAKLNYEERT